MQRKMLLTTVLVLLISTLASASSIPVRATSGIVASQNVIASKVGVDVLREGGNAVDATIATAFALAVVHPAAGNIGGGGFLLYKPSNGAATAYDFRETAPATVHPRVFESNGEYDKAKHHDSHLSVGVPGTVAGLYLAWKENGTLSWQRLIEPAERLAREGFTVTEGLAESLKRVMPRLKKYPASLAQFTMDGVPFEAGDTLTQPDLAATLRIIAMEGPTGFYTGKVAQLIEDEMERHDGLLTRQDLINYEVKKRAPISGTYREYSIVSFPPPSSGGVALVQILNILEGYDVRRDGFGSAANLHRTAEAMKRAFADRANFLGDPDFNEHMPIERLVSKRYAAKLRSGIKEEIASTATKSNFRWTYEGDETTHVSVVDKHRNAVSLTYTLENSYGSAIVVPGAGFLLNNEMGDFNPRQGLTTDDGLIGSSPNLVAPMKRMLSSMAPTIVTKDGKLFMVTGTPGGRTIINTVAQTIVNVIDHQMNAQQAVDAGRIHHQWLPDRISFEKFGFSRDSLQILDRYGHTLSPVSRQGAAQVILVNDERDVLEAGSDRRVADGGAVGY